MHTPLLDTATLPHFQQALASYRQRGYKIGIHLSEASDLDLSQHTTQEDKVVLIATKPLTLNENWTIYGAQESRLFKEGELLVQRTQ